MVKAMCDKGYSCGNEYRCVKGYRDGNMNVSYQVKVW